MLIWCGLMTGSTRCDGSTPGSIPRCRRFPLLLQEIPGAMLTVRGHLT